MWYKDKKLHLYYLLLTVFLFSACSTNKELKTKEQLKPIIEKKIEKKVVFSKLTQYNDVPQDVSYYVQDIDEKSILSKSFYKQYFRIWNIKAPSEKVQNLMWPYRSYNHKNSYGENLQAIDKEFFNKMLENSNFSKYGTLNKKALSLDLLNMRVFPTNKPLFKDPSKAGEGFPFDYIQNSSLAPNKPVLVSHYSKDKKWVLIESSFAFGWVESKNIAFVQDEDAKKLQKSEHIFITKEGVPIYSQDDNFLFHSRIGMLFSLVKENDKSYTVIVPRRGQNGEAVFSNSEILKQNANKGPLAFNKENIKIVLGDIYTSKYGWGGVCEERDCSSTLRDFYMPFGIWLPRNSYAQAQKGFKISLENLSDEDKKERIKKYAIPFETLLYMKGHIVMYVGTYNGEIVVFQNIWGLKTYKDGAEGRFIIGKSIFSTLEIGIGLEGFDKKNTLLKKIKSMNILTKTKP